MSEANLRFITNERAVKLIDELGATSNITFLIKTKEKKDIFIEELKSKLEDTELCILDSRKYKIGERKGLDILDYANDLKGIPQIINGKTVYPGNIDLPRAGSCNEKGVLIFDEVSSADEYTHAVIHTLLDTRKVISYELPKDWTIVVILDSLNFKWARKIVSNSSLLEIE